MNTKEILIAARAKIAKPENWTQEKAARDATGHDVFASSRYAVAWCAVGAIGGNGRAQAALDKVTGGIIRFNDTHTHAEVLAVFDEAIAQA